ncbi:Uu.00g141910.m01.CDS01 [Anthostomella pinea]|uniref:Uu.00g141910.m01.CDS01 n=1 Tax=Anthostomella pinea TaxID=933095 RepID=A0AAI8VQF6_9PEZI|nr:Uu.00g141910.m01.CDS01 [Anthostomella pinea]
MPETTTTDPGHKDHHSALDNEGPQQVQQVKPQQHYPQPPNRGAGSSEEGCDWPVEHTGTTPYSEKQPCAPFEETKAMITGDDGIWTMKPSEIKKNGFGQGNRQGDNKE